MHMAPPNGWHTYDAFSNMHPHMVPPTKGVDGPASSAGWQMHPMAAAMHHHQMMAANAVTSGDVRWPSDCYMGYPATGYHHHPHMVMTTASRSASAVSGMGGSRSSSPALP